MNSQLLIRFNKPEVVKASRVGEGHARCDLLPVRIVGEIGIRPIFVEKLLVGMRAVFDLEKPLIEYGSHSDQKFLEKYGPYTDLANDPRWQKITPRMSLTHSTGFNNFWFIEPDQKLRIHFDPGTRFSYSGEG